MAIISGKVIKGKQYGRVLGFPTANLDRREFSRKRMKIKLGIYAGWAIPEGTPLGLRRGCRAAIVIGPVDGTGLPKIEAHLLNFKGNLYGKKLRLVLQEYVRPFKQFKSEGELKLQIQKDIIKVRAVLK